jgi:hypothetical protein
MIHFGKTKVTTQFCAEGRSIHRGVVLSAARLT